MSLYCRTSGSSYTRTPAKKRVAELEPVEDLRNTTKPRHHQEKVAQGENVQCESSALTK